jgi:predicted ester cyclase
MSSADKNKALVRRFLEERIKGNLKAVNEMLAPDFVDFVERSLLSDQELSREDYKRSMVDIATAFSIGDWTIEDQIAEGDKVMTRWTARCVHNRGKFMGVAPTGLEGTYTGVEIHRIAGDKIAEEWSESDFSNVMRQRLEQEMREREHIEQELQVARRIQQASLPREVPTLAGWQINPFFQPAREVGGDFYEFFELDDGRVGFAVGDATGKGVPAALVMTATCAFLGGVATASGASPGEVLARANEAVLARIPPNMFVTCFYAILEPKRGSLSYANAGHDLPYLWQGGDCEELRARGMPLGLMPGMDYEEKEIVLDAGEAALFYSDGLVEAHDPKGEMFGFPRLRALVAEYGKDHSLVDSLLKELYSFTGEGWEQEDDITLLTLRRSTARH